MPLFHILVTQNSSRTRYLTSVLSQSAGHGIRLVQQTLQPPVLPISPTSALSVANAPGPISCQLQLGTHSMADPIINQENYRDISRDNTPEPPSHKGPFFGKRPYRSLCISKYLIGREYNEHNLLVSRP